MSQDFVLALEARNDLGKGASRRLRRLESQVPVIIYGGTDAPQSAATPLKDLVKQLSNEAFYSNILTLKIEGKEVKAVLKDLQRHPAKGFPMHADFQRVDASHKITMRVPLHFINEEKCLGVKESGGIISHQITDVEISCLPQNLPEFIEVDMLNINVGDSVHLSDLTIPENVQLVELSHGDENDHNLTVANVQAPKGVADDNLDDADPDAAAEESSE